MKLRRWIAAAAVALLPFTASWTGMTQAAQAAPKDTLTIGVAQFPSSLNPYIDALVVKSYVLEFAVRPITAFDPQWKNSCMLCTEVPSLKNGLAKIVDLPGGGKGMDVTIKLKPDLKWGDGVPVTTKDLEFTWKAATNPQSGFSNPHPWSRVKSITIVDDHTAVLHLDKVQNLYNSWDTLLPEHIEAPIFAKGLADGSYIKNTAYNSAPTTPGLWDGPYMITKYQSGVEIVLSANPYWGGHKPAIKTIVIKLIENTAALEQNLLSGDIDMVAGEGIGLTIDQALELQKKYPKRFQYSFRPSLTYEHIDLQIDNPILKDIRVRRALIYAANRQLMVQKLFNGMQPVADTWVNPLDQNHTNDVMKYPYDPKQAATLLKEAGWTKGADGICQNAKGEKLQLTLMTTSGNRLRELQEQVLQSMWKQACIDVTIKNEPPRTLFGTTVKHRSYTGMVMYAWSSNPGDSPRRTLSCAQIGTAANNWGGNNAIAFCDKTMDADIDAAETELDPAKQKATWADMQQIYARAAYVVPLFFRADEHVYPIGLKGYTPTGHGDMTPLWAENWHY